VRATPYGGWIVDLEQAPSAPRTLYAAAQNGSFFRSRDDGATWQRRRGVEGNYFTDLVVDPHDAGTVYARGGDYGYFRTRDGGLTWSRTAPEIEPIYTLAVDKNHPGVLFAATSEGLYRSDDGGDSWARVAFAGATVIGVAIDSRMAETIFVVIEGNSFYDEPALLWKSTDHGTTWTSSVLPSASFSRILHFVFDPVRPETLFILFNESYDLTRPALRSSDGGATWTPLPTEYIHDLAVAPDGTLLAATDYGLERSSDSGTTWTPPIEPGYFPPGGPPRDALTRLLVSSAAPGELFAAGASGVWKSGDHGASWAASNQGILAQGAYDVAVSPTEPSSVFALAGTSLFSSADQGATWIRLHSILEGPQPLAIKAFDPHDPQMLLGIETYSQDNFPVVSTNGGREWSKLHIPINCDSSDSICEVHLTMATLDPQDPASILVGGWSYYHYQGYGDFLLRSTDEGRTWKRLKPVRGIGELVVDAQQRDTYHAVGCRGAYRSTDAGATWQITRKGLPKQLCAGRRPVLTADPQDPQRLYVGTGSDGVFASSDGGVTFSAMNRGLEKASVVTLLIDPADSSKLYAGVEQQGVFRWNADLRKWTPLNRGLPLAQFAGAIALDPRQPSILYAASPVEGVFRLELEGSE
jgi:photosystem II stability/assembly factor-like uncharacterized protein